MLKNCEMLCLMLALEKLAIMKIVVLLRKELELIWEMKIAIPNLASDLNLSKLKK